VAWLPLAVATGAVAVFTAVVLHPIAALLVGAAMLLAGRQPRIRWLCAAGSLASMGLTGAFYVARQSRSQPVEGFGWPSAFRLAHPIALAAVAFLVADVVLGLLAGRGGPSTPPSEPG
jgi:hypothetical protein